MQQIRFHLTVITILVLSSVAVAQPVLPTVGKVDRDRLQAHCKQLLEALEALKAPLPPETERTLRAVLKESEQDPLVFAAEVQRVLDPHCLIGITINPESRVKAVRGPAAAELRQDQPSVMLIKVHNEAGVTQALAVAGAQLRTGDRTEPGQWLEARVAAEPPLGKTLSGNKLEYVLLRLTARESGKREATLKFDVGQGTQDLGFRAEVPVLFTIR
jgi:hypothetical protein